MANKCKYYKQRELVSYDGGVNWTPTGQYRQGDLIEYESSDCPEPSGSIMFSANYSNGASYSAACDSSSAATSAITQPNGYDISLMTSANLGECATNIGDYALANATSLTSITFTNNLTSIGDSAFANCRSLRNVIIPDSVSTIDGWAFINCSGITSCTIGTGVTTIGVNAFQNSTSLTSITINATIPPTLGTSAFDNTNNCPIYVPCASKTAYKSAWSEYADRIMCAEPKLIAQYSDSTTFSSTTCDDTRVLERTEVRAHTTSYTAMTSAVISDCVTRIGTSAFGQCTSLTAVTIPYSVTSFSSAAFSKCSSLQSLTLPQATNAIGVWSFEGCTSLTTLSIPNATQYINQGAFQNCSGLTSASIGTGVTLIDSDAFKGCSSLTSVTINATTPAELGTGAFDNTNNCPIYVPSASVNIYKAATNWSTYASRIQAIS